MRRMRSIMGPLAANTAGYAALQATTGGTPMTLAGTPQLPAPSAGQLHNSAAPVTLTTAGTPSASNFAVTGITRNGQVLTEIIPGPTSASTVSGHLLFNKVTSIVPSVSNATTISAGWGSVNYGPWLITAYHLASSVLSIYSGQPNGAVYVTDFNLLDPTFFWATQDGGGTPSGDMNFQGNTPANPYTGGPYIDQPSTPYPLVPALLQASCPQLLGTNQTLPEDDGTYSLQQIAPQTFTSAAPGTAFVGSGPTNIPAIRLDPVVAYAWRLTNTGSAGLAELDVVLQRRAY